MVVVKSGEFFLLFLFLFCSFVVVAVCLVLVWFAFKGVNQNVT